ncbi:MAG TPA: hypothetical protein VFV75_12520 [Candidatus Polarisedimenticolaceae bacterium]|nr:hypothetical protein [Candidatus Polarisedimenticolaceae bacterium]
MQTLPFFRDWFRDEARTATAVLGAWALICITMVPLVPGGAVRLLSVLAAVTAVDAAERAWNRRRRAWRAYGVSAAFMVTGFLFDQANASGLAVEALIATAVFVTLHVVVASWVRAALAVPVRGHRP